MLNGMMFLRDEAGGEGGDGGGGSGGSTITQQPNGGQGDGAKWYDGVQGLDESISGSDFVRQAPDLPTFIKNAVETKRLVGANTIKLPGQDATPEERMAVYDKLGRPATLDEYSASEGVKPKMEIKDEFIGGAKKMFHEAGLSKEQGTKILDWYFNSLNETHDQMNASGAEVQQQQITQLKEEYGDKFPMMVDAARAVVKKFGSEELNSWLDSTKINGVALGDSAPFIQMFAKIGQGMLDDNVPNGGTGLHTFMNDKSGAIAEIENLKNDEKFMNALFSDTDPQHNAAVDRWQKLHETAYPGTQQPS